MRKPKPVVVLDVDGVLADFLKPTLDVPAVKPFKKELYALWARKGLAASLPMLPGTQEAVALLRQYADIRFATSPMGANKTWIAERNRWLGKNYGARVVDVTHTGKKSDVVGDFFVDDKPDNVLEYMKNVPTARVYLRLHHYNLEFAGSFDPGFDNGFKSVIQLNEIISDVKEHAWILNSQPAKAKA